LPYITSIAVIDGEVTDKQFEPERCADPQVWNFLETVKVKRNTELSAMYPDAVANIVHVDLDDGRELTKRVDYPLGHAKNPLKDSEVEGKFLALSRPRLARSACGIVVFGNWTKQGMSMS
jgi:2-methylcitrate dehydratase